MIEVAGIVKSLTKREIEAVQEGRVQDCPYNHPIGTRCPNCAKWPFKKGGAADFVAAVRSALAKENDRGE